MSKIPTTPTNTNQTLTTAGKNLGTAGGPKLPLSLENTSVKL